MRGCIAPIKTNSQWVTESTNSVIRDNNKYLVFFPIGRVRYSQVQYADVGKISSLTNFQQELGNKGRTRRTLLATALLHDRRADSAKVIGGAALEATQFRTLR